MVKVKDAGILSVVFNTAIKTFTARNENKFNFSFAMVAALVQHSFESVPVIPLAFVLSRRVVFPAVVSIDIRFQPSV